MLLTGAHLRHHGTGIVRCSDALRNSAKSQRDMTVTRIRFHALPVALKPYLPAGAHSIAPWAEASRAVANAVDQPPTPMPKESTMQMAYPKMAAEVWMSDFHGELALRCVTPRPQQHLRLEAQRTVNAFIRLAPKALVDKHKSQDKSKPVPARVGLYSLAAAAIAASISGCIGPRSSSAQWPTEKRSIKAGAFVRDRPQAAESLSRRVPKSMSGLQPSANQQSSSVDTLVKVGQRHGAAPPGAWRAAQKNSRPSFSMTVADMESSLSLGSHVKVDAKYRKVSLSIEDMRSLVSDRRYDALSRLWVGFAYENVGERRQSVSNDGEEARRAATSSRSSEHTGTCNSADSRRGNGMGPINASMGPNLQLRPRAPGNRRTLLKGLAGETLNNESDAYLSLGVFSVVTRESMLSFKRTLLIMTAFYDWAITGLRLSHAHHPHGERNRTSAGDQGVQVGKPGGFRSRRNVRKVEQDERPEASVSDACLAPLPADRREAKRLLGIRRYPGGCQLGAGQDLDRKLADRMEKRFLLANDVELSLVLAPNFGRDIGGLNVKSLVMADLLFHLQNACCRGSASFHSALVLGPQRP
ncbi:hypothetical protein AURDEDRAFT_152922 [Auricularia subglabra TFB-10046 SS5]|nr:hypothetical protein AURDEDRAFT_152922 [Auricularia subglabra TFB-10046 SS5]